MFKQKVKRIDIFYTRQVANHKVSGFRYSPVLKSVNFVDFVNYELYEYDVINAVGTPDNYVILPLMGNNTSSVYIQSLDDISDFRMLNEPNLVQDYVFVYNLFEEAHYVRTNLKILVKALEKHGATQLKEKVSKLLDIYTLDNLANEVTISSVRYEGNVIEYQFEEFATVFITTDKLSEDLDEDDLSLPNIKRAAIKKYFSINKNLMTILPEHNLHIKVELKSKYNEFKEFDPSFAVYLVNQDLDQQKLLCIVSLGQLYNGPVICQGETV